MMRKPGMLLLILLVWDISGYGQLLEKDSVLNIFANWSSGDSVRFDIYKSREKYENGERKSTGYSTTPVTVQVLTASDSSYTLRWKYQEGSVNGVKASEVLQNNPILQLLSNLTYEFRTNEMGSFVELTNWKEVQKYVNSMVDELLKGKQGDASMEKISGQMKQMFSSRESIEQVIAKDLQLVHFLYGVSLVKGDTVLTDMELPNILGGDTPLPATMRIYFSGVSNDGKTALVIAEQFIDEARANDMIRKSLEQMNQGGKPIGDLPVFKMNNQFEFEVDTQTGWMQKVRSTRTVKTEKVQQVDVQEFRLVK